MFCVAAPEEPIMSNQRNRWFKFGHLSGSVKTQQLKLELDGDREIGFDSIDHFTKFVAYGGLLALCMYE